MYKWINWALRMAATALLLSFLSIWTTGYIVNSYMETLLKQLDLPLQTQPFALSGVWGKLWGATPVPVADETASAEPKPSPEETANESGNARPDGESSPSASASASPGPSQPAAGAEASGSPEPSTDEEESEPVFGGNAGILDMTDQQRQTLSTVMSKLNGEQLGILSLSLENGLTELELKQLEEMLEPLLTEAEYSQIMELLEARVTKPGEEPETPV